MPAARRIAHTLRRVFGLAQLRPGQEAVIDRVLKRRSTLAVMPTGAGKSLCYQLPAVLRPGRTIVVSPLIALMKDQCDGLLERGVPAVAWHSGLDAQATAAAEAAIDDGRARIVFVTPERLGEPEVLARLRTAAIALLVVDEAHCISQWGRDFRPAYRALGAARAALGDPPVLALTATADEQVAADVAEQLGIRPADVVRTGSYRPNLRLRVEPLADVEDKLGRLLALLEAEPGAGIVYTATVKAAQEVHEALVGKGLDAALYHGRLRRVDRHAVQDVFMSGAVRVMVATNAFGMGIDRPDLRFVVHWQIPAAPDVYYQEAGRAGRDGEPATCTLLFVRRDKAVQSFFLARRGPGDEDVEAVYRRLAQPAETPWTLPALASATALPRPRVQAVINVLRAARVLTQDRRGTLRVTRSQLDAGTLAATAASDEARRRMEREQLEHMVFYAQTGLCRWRVLLEHLDGVPAGFDRCGHCDNCARLAQHLQEQAQPDAVDEGHRSDRAAFSPGDAVRVRRYGNGRVRTADALQVEVEFASGDVRSFLPEWVLPVRTRRAR